MLALWKGLGRVRHFVQSHQVGEKLDRRLPELDAGVTPRWLSATRHRARHARHRTHRFHSSCLNRAMGLQEPAGLTLQFFEHFVYPFLEVGGIREPRQMLMFFLWQHNQPSEQTSIYVRPDVAVVVVERPGSDRLFSYLK